jgi:hypothetical protein
VKGVLALVAAVRAARAGQGSWGPIVVAGARELVPLLVRDLRAGGDPTAVREGSPLGASVFVWLGKPDVAALREASLARVPIVGVTEGESLPYVLDTNLVVVRPGEGLPVDRIARAIARLVDAGWSELAVRLPVLRAALVGGAVRRQAAFNALAAGRSEAVQLPALAVSHLRLGGAIGRAYGVPNLLAPGLAAGAGLGLLVRVADEQVPGARRIVRAVVAGGGTLLVGEAARRYLESVRPGT